MAKGKPKVLKFIDTLKRGYNSLLGKELAGAINKKAIAGVKAIPGFKKGGVVRRTGKALVHKGEVVLSVAQRKALKKMLH
jgi:hypothetical protein